MTGGRRAADPSVPADSQRIGDAVDVVVDRKPQQDHGQADPGMFRLVHGHEREQNRGRHQEEQGRDRMPWHRYRLFRVSGSPAKHENGRDSVPHEDHDRHGEVNIRPAGRLAARAPKQIAPPAAATPVVNQTASSQNGEPSDFTMPAVVRKIPTPITSATMSAVAVVSPNCRESPGS